MLARLQRAGVCATISATGGIVVGIMGFHAATHSLPMVGILLAAFGGLIGLALVAAGAVLYRSDVATIRTARIAGWNGLGIVVIGAAMLLFYTYQSAVGSPASNPVFAGAVVVGVSAVAHVLIGVNDVRRIRARELAQERQKLSVLTRLVRHNLRTEAQLLYSYGSQVTDHATEGSDLAELGTRIQQSGETFVEMHESIKLLTEVIDADLPARAIDLPTVVADCVEELREQYPGAEIETDVPDTLQVRAGEYLQDALGEVIENAIVHAETESPTVTVSVTTEANSWVVLSVRDDGPGIPEQDREVVLGSRDITQLDHASGLGLWLVRWILDAYDGELDIRQPDDGGSDVHLRLRAA